MCHGVRKDLNAEYWSTSIEHKWPRLPVPTLQGFAEVRGRGGAALWPAQCLFGATEMIGARVRVVSEGGSFTIVVCAESLREVEQTAKARYPESTVRIAFPIEPEWFFAGSPHTGLRAGLKAMEGLTD